MKQSDKAALLEWGRFKEDIARATPVDRSMSHAERERHRRQLEAHPVEWITFFCAPYVKCAFAGFHKQAIRRLTSNDEW